MKYLVWTIAVIVCMIVYAHSANAFIRMLFFAIGGGMVGHMAGILDGMRKRGCVK